MEKLNDRIKNLRKEKGWTQLQLAEKLNVTDKAVSKWEVGEANPDLSSIVNIASLFGVTIDYLLTGKVEEEKISLDDMDASKRMEYLIKKDDAENFVKYDYIRKSNKNYDNAVFVRDIRFGNANLTYLNKDVWVKLFENSATKILSKCFDKFVELNTTEVSAAVLVVDFMDDFVRYAVKLDRDDVLKCIGARYFSIGNAYQTKHGRDGIPLLAHRQTHLVPLFIDTNYDDFMSSFISFGISRELFKEILTSEEASPKCYEYLTSKKFYIVPKSLGCNHRYYGYGRNLLAFTNYDSELLDVLIEINSFDKIKEFCKAYGKLLKDLELDRNFEEIRGTYAVRQGFAHGRVMTFSMNQITSCIEKGEVELAKLMISHNKNIISKYTSASSSYGRIVQNIAVLSDAEIQRKVELGRTDLSDDDKLMIECVNNHIIVPGKLIGCNNLKFIRKVLDNNAYHYYEFVYNCLTKGKVKELFEFFVDNGLEEMAANLMFGSERYSEVLSNSFYTFIKDPNNNENISYSYNKYIGLLTIQNLTDFESLTQGERQQKCVYTTDNYGRSVSKMEYCKKYVFQNDFKRNHGDFSDFAGCLEENPIIEHIKELKESIYIAVSNRLEAEKKAKEEAMEREKVTKSLTKEYFENLLSTGGTELFYIKLCSLLDAIFKYDYHYEGEDFSARMNAHFAKLEALAPKSRDCDDGWEYMVLDTEYEENVVKPEAKKIAHLRDIFNRLRMQRNNISHPKKENVKELTNSELIECLEYVFSINRKMEG